MCFSGVLCVLRVAQGRPRNRDWVGLRRRGGCDGGGGSGGGGGGGGGGGDKWNTKERKRKIEWRGRMRWEKKEI